MEKNCSRQLIICCIYLVSILLGIVLWFPFPNTIHFFGASSLFYAFLLAISSVSSALTFLSISWIIVFSVGIIVCFLIAKRKDYYVPFFFAIAIEIVVSLAFLVIKIVLRNYTDLLLSFVGLTIRLFSFFIIWKIKGQPIGKGERSIGVNRGASL